MGIIQRNVVEDSRFEFQVVYYIYIIIIAILLLNYKSRLTIDKKTA